MNSKKIALIALMACALALQACGGPSTADVLATGVAQTVQISQLETAAASSGQQQATPTVAEGQTDVPTATLTATSSIPFVSVSQNTNCRTGPSPNYDLVTTIQVGQQVEVLKVFNTANYVIVRNPVGGGDCWLWLQYAIPANFAQYDLPVATQPPTPTPTATTQVVNWNGTWDLWNPGGPYTLTMSQIGNQVDGSYGGISINGTLNADHTTLTGTWWSLFTNGTFSLHVKEDNPDQLIGNWDGTNPYCAARSGVAQPVPCLWP